MSSTIEEPCDSTGHVCKPLALVPAWWSAFMFHVLNPRQVCMYLYLSMVSDEKGECSPTIDQIREDLGLYSSSMVFEALAALEDLGFIVRERLTLQGARSRRNRYRRPSCESTILRLLERGRIDAEMHSSNPMRAAASPESQALIVAGLRDLLGDENYERYVASPREDKREVLISFLSAAA